MKATDPIKENHQARSDFVRKLVQHSPDHDVPPAVFLTETPRTLVQFWNDLNQLPEDVKECIDSWKNLEEQGFELVLFDDVTVKQLVFPQMGFGGKLRG